MVKVNDQDTTPRDVFRTLSNILLIEAATRGVL